MKAQSFGNPNRGVSTLEILIAFTVITLSIVAVTMIVLGSQSVAIDTQTNIEAIGKAQSQLETARALSRKDFSSVVTIPKYSWSPPGGLTYFASTTVSDLTQCKKQATSTVTWTNQGRPQKIEISTFLSDIAGALAIGGDCAASPPTSGWTNPQRFASDTMSPGKPTAMDVLDRIAYLGADATPFFYIADTRSATLGQTSGIFVSNSYNLGAQPNALDAIKWYDSSSGTYKYYVFAAMDTTTNQLKVIDVTVPSTPSTLATVPLSTCVAGSNPEGWNMYYYKNYLYLIVRFTAGPEFHVFDVSTPASPTELSIGSAICKGYELGETAESLVVKDQTIGGVTKRYAYLATDDISRELDVLDVTDPLAITRVTAAVQDLPGAQDGASVFSVGNKLYFGRQSSTGSDLYVFDITNPTAGLTTLGSKDIGTGVIGLQVVGKFAFLATPKVNKEFQVWDISNLGNITLIKDYNFGNVVANGVDYEPDFIYATGQSTPNFQIIYSP
jgi:hypothetical protein